MYEWAGRWLHTSRTRTNTDLGVPVQVNQAYKSPAGLIVATIEIPLTRGYVTRIYEADRPFTDGHSWYTSFGPHTVYAVTKIGGKPVRLHNLLTGWEYVDHEDGDGLNNCRHNLRDGSGFKNHANTWLRADNTSGFKGAIPLRGKWQAQIRVNGKSIYLGIYGTPEAAADAYDEAAIHYFGEWARTNAMMAREGVKTRPPERPAPVTRIPVTQCPAGHKYTPENTYTSPNGKRHCRTCKREVDRARNPARGRKCRPGCTCGRHSRSGRKRVA
jgi:hypothetical protein